MTNPAGSQSSFRVHFVCRGNVYRSRIAEAYLRSKAIPGVTVTSSGVAATDNQSAQIATLPLSIAQAAGFDSWQNFDWTQTSQAELDRADIIIFLNDDIESDAKCDYSLSSQKYEIWDVANLDEELAAEHSDISDSATIEKLIEAAITAIEAHVDQLTHDIVLSGVVDVVDTENKLLGYRLPLAWVNKKALWYRACHGVVVTANGRFVVEKRSHDIVFAPDLLDITFGGGIDSGEEPVAAALREGHDELGLDFSQAQVHDLGVTKFSAYHPSYKLHTKCFIYSYLLKLADADPVMTLETSEVAAVYLLSMGEIERLVQDHHLQPYGYLNTHYAYYRALLTKVTAVLD